MKCKARNTIHGPTFPVTLDIDPVKLDIDQNSILTTRQIDQH